METTKVIIENWPKDPWLKTWMPLIISSIFTLIALFLSLKSFYFTKNESARNSRPYVWALSTNDANTNMPIPQFLSIINTNSPAKILKEEVKIILVNGVTKTELVTYLKLNFVSFPSQNTQRGFTIGHYDWNNKVLSVGQENLAKLERHVLIQYSFLDGREKFEFKLVQKFIPDDNQWRDFDLQAY
jgi:hypothetical protein